MKILVEKAVIEQALEALEKFGIEVGVNGSVGTAITTLREALDPELQFVRDWNEGNVRRISDGKVMGFAEQAEQEPFKMICPRCKVDRVTTQCPNRGGIGDCPMTATAQSAAPVKSICYQEAYDALEAQLIKEPTGNGLDQVAQNNGLIIAMNTLQKMNLAKQAEGAIVKTCPDGYGTITTEQAEQEPVLWGDDKFAPHKRPQKPEECANGCPPLQVCDYCQTAEQAEQEPMAIDWEPLQNFWRNNSGIDWEEFESAVKCAVAAPVRTKDLTDDEIEAICADLPFDENFDITVARAVIAAYKEKNK